MKPHAAPLPQHILRSISPTGRFVAYVEDDPMAWSQAFDDRNAALDAMRWLVSQRLTLNGAGCGAVLDDDLALIVAVDQMPMPRGQDMLETVEFVREICGR